MSAYVVDRNHIAYLVDAAMSHALGAEHHGGLVWVWEIDRGTGNYSRSNIPIADYNRAAEVGQMLWSENVASVRYRYPDCTDELPGPIGESCIYEKHEPAFYRTVDPVAVLKACDCYEYQSCEHREWEVSEAHAFIMALRSRAIHALPGYDEASWGAPA